jgi:uncharacterized protein (DUF58 family)
MAKNQPQQRITLKLRRIYILPSRHGLMFALALLVMLMGSINYSNSMGFVLTFLLGGMAMVGILHTYRNLAGLSLEAGRATPVFAGEYAHFGISLDNYQQPPRYAISLGLYDSKEPLLTLDVPANQRLHSEIKLLTEQRGYFQLPRLRVNTTFPLGLFYAWSEVQLDMRCLVYPKPEGSYELPPGKAENGQNQSRMGEGGEDFVGYRDYTLSDSPRHVDWKIVAREQGWHIKQFGGQSGLSLWLTWNDVAHVRDTDIALSQLSRWVVEAEAQQLAYGLEIPGHSYPPDQGQAHYHRCLEALALFG